MRDRISRWAAPLGLALMLSGCGLSGLPFFGGDNQRVLPSAEDLESQAQEAGRDYVIGPRDRLLITVWNQPELNVGELVVRLDGRISFPLLDDVQASGLTPLALKGEITRRLEEYVRAPHVTVVVTEINSKLIYVLGEVVREGPIVYRARMRVVDALSTAGGFNQFAGKKHVKVIRDRNGDAPLEFTFNYDEFVRGKNLEQNILLLPGDRIVIPPESPFPW
ncbi:MAG: polysaccharide biosynthesis/export family protein [Myxococcota bacterium]